MRGLLKIAALTSTVFFISTAANARTHHRKYHHHRHHHYSVVHHTGGNVHARSGASAHVAASAASKFQCIVNKLEAQGYPIRFMGGWRAHGSVKASLHSLGLALDINQTARGVTHPRMPRNEIAIANSCGAISRAQWVNNDSGHFQIGGYAGPTHRHYAKRTHYRHYAKSKRPHYANADE